MERIELDLKALAQNDSLKITQNYKERKIIYDVTVVKPGEKPLCNIEVTHDDGSKAGPSLAILEGSGKWTTPRENPVQEGAGDWRLVRDFQEKAFSIYYGHLYTGGELTIINPDTKQRFLLEGRIENIEQIKDITKPQTA